MARIRTIKPDFFRHGDLFDAEKDSGLPLRVAFAGLWCSSDKEGRFKWKPRDLKVEVLPHDELDFSRVLDALATRGFIVKYEHSGQVYGFIPSWRKHQVINNKETPSDLPDPNGKGVSLLTLANACATREEREDDAKGTDAARDGDAFHKEGKGKEGKGKKITPAPPGSREPVDPIKLANAATWKAYAHAFALRYKTKPVRNEKVNSQIVQLVKRLGAEEAPAVAAHYVALEGFYAQRKHTVDLLLSNAESLRTEWASAGKPSVPLNGDSPQSTLLPSTGAPSLESIPV